MLNLSFQIYRGKFVLTIRKGVVGCLLLCLIASTTVFRNGRPLVAATGLFGAAKTVGCTETQGYQY